MTFFIYKFLKVLNGIKIKNLKSIEIELIECLMNPLVKKDIAESFILYP